jgi:hypothetical protein
MKILHKVAILEVCQDQYRCIRQTVHERAAISRKELIILLDNWVFLSCDSFNLAFWIDVLNIIDELLSRSFDELLLKLDDVSKQESFTSVTSLLIWTAKFLNLSYNKPIYASLDVCLHIS